MNGSGQSNHVTGNSASGATPDSPDPSSQDGRLLIVAMDLLRLELTKTTQAIVENARAYSLPSPSTEVDPATGFPVPNGSQTPSPDPSDPQQQQQPPRPPIDPATGLPTQAPGPIDPASGLPTGQADEPPIAEEIADGNAILEAILAQLKATADGQKAARDKLAQDKQDKQDRAEARLTPGGIRAQMAKEKDRRNQQAYERRVKAGQQLGDYDKGTNYFGNMRDPKATRSQNAAYNRAARTVPGASGAGGVAPAAAGLAKVFSQLASVVLKGLGPIGILIGLLTATSSGFGKFLQVIDMMYTALGAVLLPIFVLMSAVLLTLTAIFFDKMLPMMEKWFEIIFALVPLFEGLLKVVVTLYDLWMALIKAIAEFIQFIAKIIQQQFDTAAEQLPGGKEVLDQAKEAAQKALDDAKKKAGGGEEDDVGKEFRKATRDIIASLKQDIGAKATLVGLETDWNQKLLAALNKDPLEARKMEMLRKILDALERALNKADAKNNKAEAPVKGGDGNAQAGMNPNRNQGQQGIG